MKKRFIPFIGASVSVFACLFASNVAHAAVDAAKAADLAQKSGCMACHGIDKKIVGPAYKDVAKKYKGNKDAEAMLVKKIKEGGAGVWGPIPMPANSPQVSDTNIKTLTAWILSLN
ncbi:MAG TPA: c-type cytochrome [Burkholderiaceae bacterium]|nr:c-type cytochrome [Burkholderiaceae bacterium]